MRRSSASGTHIELGYVAFGFSVLLAIGMLFSTLTDTVASVIGVQRSARTLSRRSSTASANSAKFDMRSRRTTSTHGKRCSPTTPIRGCEMAIGIVVQLAYLVVVGAVAVMWFNRKDIRS